MTTATVPRSEVKNWTSRNHLSRKAWYNREPKTWCAWFIRPLQKLPEKKGFCEVCLRWCQTDWHHIKYRSQGGGNDVDNLLEVCRMCHSAIHNGVISKEEVASVKRGDGL